MMPSALIYDAKLVNARSHGAVDVKINFVPMTEQTKVVADCAGARMPCFYRAEVRT